MDGRGRWIDKRLIELSIGMETGPWIGAQQWL
jgi:hypothetical protein